MKRSVLKAHAPLSYAQARMSATAGGEYDAEALELYCGHSSSSSSSGSKYLGFAARLGDALAILGVVGPHAVHLVRCGFSGGIPFALLGDDVNQHWPHSLCGLHLCTSPTHAFIPASSHSMHASS